MEQSPFWESESHLAQSRNSPPFMEPEGSFIIVFTMARHWSLSWARCIQSTPLHPTSRRPILILFYHLRLGFPNDLFHSDIPTKILYAVLIPPMRATCPSRLILFDITATLLITGFRSSVYIFIHLTTFYHVCKLYTVWCVWLLMINGIERGKRGDHDLFQKGIQALIWRTEENNKNYSLSGNL